MNNFLFITGKLQLGMVAKDLRPLSVFEGTGFQELAQELVNIGSKYGPLNVKDILYSRRTMSRKILPETYEEVRKKLKQELEKLFEEKKLNFTADHWESKAKDKYMGITVHYINEDLEMVEKTIGCSQQPESKTGKFSSV